MPGIYMHLAYAAVAQSRLGGRPEYVLPLRGGPLQGHFNLGKYLGRNAEVRRQREAHPLAIKSPGERSQDARVQQAIKLSHCIERHGEFAALLQHWRHHWPQKICLERGKIEADYRACAHPQLSRYAKKCLIGARR